MQECFPSLSFCFKIRKQQSQVSSKFWDSVKKICLHFQGSKSKDELSLSFAHCIVIIFPYKILLFILKWSILLYMLLVFYLSHLKLRDLTLSLTLVTMRMVQCWPISCRLSRYSLQLGELPKSFLFVRLTLPHHWASIGCWAWTHVCQFMWI